MMGCIYFLVSYRTYVILYMNKSISNTIRTVEPYFRRKSLGLYKKFKSMDLPELGHVIRT